MTKKIKSNAEAVKVYIANDGQNCLFCGEANPEGSSFDVRDGAARQEMSCNYCEEEWVDSYRLSAVIHNGNVYEPPNEVDALKAEIERLKNANRNSLKELFREFTSKNFTDVGEMMGELARQIGTKPKEDADFLKAEVKLFNQWTLIELQSLWNRIRAVDMTSASTLISEIAFFIGEKRGDVTSLCGCGGLLEDYKNLVGYEASVCKDCGQRFPVL